MSPPSDPTVDPELSSWLPVPDGSDFPIQNLPLGIFGRSGERSRAGVAIGTHVLDLALLAERGFFEGIGRPGVFAVQSLNLFLLQGPSVWRAVRGRISGALRSDTSVPAGARRLVEEALVPMADVDLRVPVIVGDYVDFYSSLHHATNMGRMFRPDTEPLLPNWRWLPVGYHGRTSTIVVSGTPVVRPLGQAAPDEAGRPVFGPSRALDIELEIGFITGTGRPAGRPVTMDVARDTIFGMVLVNDWSARDIQRWEYQPLGPFLGKSFATSISPWVVTLDALEPYRVPGPVQDPPPLEHLRTGDASGYDIELQIELQTARMAAEEVAPQVLSRTSFREMYWTIAQQLAHVTSNGTTVRSGDLYASGTISGPDPGSFGSLIELTWKGERPIELSTGERRAFLEDGDTVVMRAWAGDGRTRPRIGFGELRGTIVAAQSTTG